MVIWKDGVPPMLYWQCMGVWVWDMESGYDTGYGRVLYNDGGTTVDRAQWCTLRAEPAHVHEVSTIA